MVYDTVWSYRLQENRLYRHRFQYDSGSTQDGVYYTRQNRGRSLYHTVCQRTERSTAKLWGVSGRNGKCMFISAKRVLHKMLKIIKSKCLLYYSVRLKTFQLVLVFCWWEQLYLNCIEVLLLFFRLLVNEGWSTDSLIAAGSLLNTKKTDGSLTLELSAKYVRARTDRKIS